MATCRDIIRTSLRKIGVLAAGAEPKAREATDALEALQSLYLEWVDGAVFGALTEVLATEDYEAGENERVLSGGYTITLPETVVDADTGVDRSPVDMAVVSVVTAGQDPEISLYDANRGEWLSLNGLELADEAPLSSRGADGLASLLAKRIAAEYGEGVSDQTEMAAARFSSNISLKRTSRSVEVSYF